MDRLIEYVNANAATYNVSVFYSTPSTYVAAVHALSLTWEQNNFDFFPYSDTPDAFWTGYFTSRAALKGYGAWRCGAASATYGASAHRRSAQCVRAEH